MTIQNSKGRVYYGLHMYPGVAEYKESGDAFRVFVNEDTIRGMGPTFAGRPVFVMHVDEVAGDLDALKNDADGWVVKSFYNEADGKHWVEFIVVSDKGEQAIKSGYRLSNCYVPKAFERGGEWNGVSYQKEVTSGEYEHLAIVPNPRYEESVVLTPDQFKEYNESKRIELQRLANDKGGKSVLKFFKKAKVENSGDLENMVVVLPKSGREVDITTLVNEADAAQALKNSGASMYANDDQKVKVGEGEMTVKELVNAYQEKCNAEKEVVEDVVENEDDMELENEVDDEDAKSKAKALVEHEEKEIEEKKTKNAKAKADAIRNAHTRGNAPEPKVFDPTGGVERGKSRYGT